MKRLALVAVLFGCLMLTGCGTKAAEPLPGTPAGTLQSAPAQADAAATAACSSNRAQLSAEYSVVQSGASTEADTSFGGVVQRSGAKCPSGGAYSWDAATNKAKCSIHGE